MHVTVCGWYVRYVHPTECSHACFVQWPQALTECDMPLTRFGHGVLFSRLIWRCVRVWK